MIRFFLQFSAICAMCAALVLLAEFADKIM